MRLCSEAWCGVWFVGMEQCLKEERASDRVV